MKSRVCVSRFISCALALVLSMSLFVPTARAADIIYDDSQVAPELHEGCYFEDVPLDVVWFNDVYDLVDAGIIFGTSEYRFSPYQCVTARQVLITVARMRGEIIEDQDAFMSDAIQKHLIEDVTRWDAELTREQAIVLLFRALGAMPACNTSHTEIYSDRVGFRFIAQVTQDLGLFTFDTTNPTGRMERWEYADLLNACRQLLLSGDNRIEQLGFGYIDFSTEEGYEKYLQKMCGYMLHVPFDILQLYHKACYTVVIGDEYIKSYVEEKGSPAGMSIIGLFSTKSKSIFMTQPHAIMHEMGHFCEQFMAGKEDIKALYKAEKEKSQEIPGVGTYALTDSREFFGEMFRFFIQNRDDEMQMDIMHSLTPMTYQYFLDLEANQWLRVNGELPPRNFVVE